MFIFMTFRSSWLPIVHRHTACIPLEILCKNNPSHHQSYSGPTRVASAWNGQHCWPILYVLFAAIPPYTSRRSWRARWRLSSWRSTLIPSMVCVERGEVTYIDGLVQDCSISIALAMEILQSCTKPSIWSLMFYWTLWNKKNTLRNF